jgi:hypothetical protein
MGYRLMSAPPSKRRCGKVWQHRHSERLPHHPPPYRGGGVVWRCPTVRPRGVAGRTPSPTFSLLDRRPASRHPSTQRRDDQMLYNPMKPLAGDRPHAQA